VSAVEKDSSIIEALKALKARFGETLQVDDRWEGDLMAVGVSRHGHPDRLVYFCTFQRGTGRYYVDLEAPAPPGSQLPYEQGETFEDVDFETLASIVSRHLGVVPGEAA
jgi:hypothetical protein